MRDRNWAGVNKATTGTLQKTDNDGGGESDQGQNQPGPTVVHVGEIIALVQWRKPRILRQQKSLRDLFGLWLSCRGQPPGQAGCPVGYEIGLDMTPSREAMNRCRLTIYYSGRVQGVGFRFTTKSVAAGYDVVGAVRNLPDGRVELMAEGTREELDAFRRAIQDSEVGGLIRHEEVAWSAATGAFRDFEIGG